jgi:hypothetical protein
MYGETQESGCGCACEAPHGDDDTGTEAGSRTGGRTRWSARPQQEANEGSTERKRPQGGPGAVGEEEGEGMTNEELVRTLLENQNRLTERMADLAAIEGNQRSDINLLAVHAADTNSKIRQLTANVEALTANVDAFVKESRERIVYVEAQLDALVRAIVKPTNGKT